MAITKPFSYKCSACNVTLDSLFEFAEHENTHTLETPFMCPMCHKCFGLIQQYVDHVKKVHGIQGCRLSNGGRINCLHSLENPSGTRTHGGSTESNKRNFCSRESESVYLNDACRFARAVNSKSIGKRRLIVENNGKKKSFSCEECNGNFSTVESLDRHRCPPLPENPSLFQCSCLKNFATSEEFKLHLGRSKPYACCDCLMKFNAITNLIRHIRTHTKDKPYKCDDCGRGFAQSAHLKNHSSLHLGISAVKCTECDFSCKTFGGLLKHRKKHEGGEGLVGSDAALASSTVCPVCDKKFSFKRNMAMHMKVHGDPLSLCPDCGKVFASKAKLTSHFKACHREPSACKTCGKCFASSVLAAAHEKIHSSDKPFSCTVCSKSFSVRNYLRQHMKTHSDKKKFTCSKCGKLFKVSVSLKYHDNICTGGIPSTIP